MQTDLHFDAIYESYNQLVFNLALHYVQHTGDAQDITQEVFVKVWQHYHKYDPAAASLKTWISRITINQSLDFIKARQTKKRFGFITSLFQPNNNEPAHEPAHFNHPGVLAEDREALQLLFRYINTLPHQQKTAIILSKIEQRPLKEVAEIMNLSVKAVESLLQRAKQTLAKYFAGREGF